MKSALTLLLTSLLAMPTCLADDDQSALLGQWTFNTGSTSAARLQSSNPAAGVTLSSLAINSKVTDFRPGGIPSGDDDGMGFGGNNGAQVMFWHRANNPFFPRLRSAPLSFNGLHLKSKFLAIKANS